MDSVEVFSHIVCPIDVYRTEDCRPAVYNLFVDHYKLTASQVAISSAWWRHWVAPQHKFIQQNLTFTVDTLQKNTTDSLWRKVLEDQDEFAEDQQGGPLLLFLILKRIRASSEAALDNLKLQFRNLKIRDIPGEDVDIAVSFVKSTEKALLGASRPDRSFIPDDFVPTLYEIYTTSTVEPFNRVFRDEKELLLREGDKSGTTPEWPKPRTLNSLATATYARLKSDGKWDVPEDPKKKSAGGYSATPQQGNEGKQRRSGKPRGTVTCFNCKGPHLLPDCPKPRDEDEIAKNKAAYNKNRKPKHKTGKDGKPLILNKKGSYVLDTKKAREQGLPTKKDKKETPTANMMELIRALTSAAVRTPPQETPSTPSQPDVLPTPNTTYDPDAIRAALGRYLN
jgi:hypothetical protein